MKTIKSFFKLATKNAGLVIALGVMALFLGYFIYDKNYLTNEIYMF